ncbi:MAG: hypothetical protein IMZ69_07375, partial [Spirochaetes bacterium]|nr:hypothetical protein [Spirochaetota bacterium]
MRGDSVTILGRRFSRAALAIAWTLLALCSITLVSLVLHVAKAAGPAGLAAASLGRFLFDGFSWAAFFVPVYLLAGVRLLAAPIFRRRSALRLMLSIIPFLTLGLLLHVLQRTPSPLAMLLADSFGVIPAALLLFLLLALEAIFLLTLPYGLGGKAGTTIAHQEAAIVVVETSENGEAVETDGAAQTDDDAEPIDPAEAAHSFDPDEAASGSAGDNGAPAPMLRSRTTAAPDYIETTLPQAELPFEPAPGKSPYGIPVNDVLKQRGDNEYWVIDDETRREAQILTDTLKEFNIEAEVTGIRKGPVITLFEVLPAQGVRISKIANLSDNIALRLAAPSVRIVAPIPGRHAVGIEVPNRKRAIVS